MCRACLNWNIIFFIKKNGSRSINGYWYTKISLANILYLILINLTRLKYWTRKNIYDSVHNFSLLIKYYRSFRICKILNLHNFFICVQCKTTFIEPFCKIKAFFFLLKIFCIWKLNNWIIVYFNVWFGAVRSINTYLKL